MISYMMTVESTNTFIFGCCKLKRCLLLISITSVIVIATYLELDKILHCDWDEARKVIKAPDGKYVQKIGPFIGMKAYSELSRNCSYNSSNKLDCPDIRLKGETVIRQIQLVMTRILLIFEAICKKHDIKYWFVAGTLLGAVRHKGFIPWDNDMDIAMLRKDYEKFVEVAKTDLPNDIFLQNAKTDQFYAKYQKNEAKLRDEKSCQCLCLRYGCQHHDGLMFDIFVLDEKVPDTFIDFWDRFHYKYNEIFPLQNILFEGFKFPVPNRYFEILKREYGNYKKAPSDRKVCPSKGYIGNPWYSCAHVNSKKNSEREKLIYDSRISSDWILYYVY